MSFSLVPTIENTKSGTVLTFFIFVVLLWAVTLTFGVPDLSNTGILFFLTLVSLLLTSFFVSANAVNILQRKITRFRKDDEIWVGEDRKDLFTYPAFRRYIDGATARFILGTSLLVFGLYMIFFGNDLLNLIFLDEKKPADFQWGRAVIAIFLMGSGFWLTWEILKRVSEDRTFSNWNGCSASFIFYLMGWGVVILISNLNYVEKVWINFGLTWQEGISVSVITFLACTIIFYAYKDASDERVLFSILWYVRTEMSSEKEKKWDILAMFSDMIQTDKWERLHRTMKFDFFEEVYNNLMKLDKALKEFAQGIKNAEDEILPLFPYSIVTDHFESITLELIREPFNLRPDTVGWKISNPLKDFLNFPKNLTYWKNSEIHHKLKKLYQALQNLFKTDILIINLSSFYFGTESTENEFAREVNSFGLEEIKANQLFKIPSENLRFAIFGFKTVQLVATFAKNTFNKTKSAIKMYNLEGKLKPINISVNVKPDFDSFDNRLQKVREQWENDNIRKLIKLNSVKSFREKIKYHDEYVRKYLKGIYDQKTLDTDFQMPFNHILENLLEKRDSILDEIRELLNPEILQKMILSVPFFKNNAIEKKEDFKEI